MSNKIKQNLARGSWVMYDFANTFFAMNIASLYFTLWVTVEKKAPEIIYALSITASVILVIIFTPVFGIISDRIGKKMVFLFWFTLLCVGLTFVLGFLNSLLLGLIYFIFANLFYQLACVFYNALLPDITEPDTLGRISGYGVGLSYCGTIASLILIRPFVLKGTYQDAFIPTAVYFFIFSLPIFLFIKDNQRTTLQAAQRFEFGNLFLRVLKTFKDIRSNPAMFNFFLSTFLALNAINAVIIFMSVYSKNVIGFSDREINNFFIVSGVFAMLGSFLSGFSADKLGTKETLRLVFLSWMITLILACASFSKPIFWLVGPLGGLSLGSTWVTTRALAIQLMPKERLVEFLSVYGITGKVSSVFGPVVWGLITLKCTGLGMSRYRVAILVLVMFILSGFIFFQKISGIPGNKNV